MRLIGLLALLTLGLLARVEPATALSCPATIDSISFGTIDSIPTSDGGTLPDLPAQANVTITCTGGLVVLGAPVPPNVQICANIGTGNGGTGNNPRVMAGTPGGTLGYQLYTDPGRTTVWGTGYGTAFGTVPVITIALNSSGAGSTTVQLYAKLPASSMPVAAGSYLSTFTAAHTRFDYGQISTLLGCGLLASLGSQANPTFAVSATVNKKCYVNSDPIAFAATTAISSDRFANGRVGVRCTPSTTYTIGLDNGQAGTGPTARKMRKLTAPAGDITYGLYRDTPPTLAWGNTVGTNTASGTGNASQTDFTVYGKVPIQTTPPPGAYTDSVIATITY